MRPIPESANRQDWPRLVAAAVNFLLAKEDKDNMAENLEKLALINRLNLVAEGRVDGLSIVHIVGTGSSSVVPNQRGPYDVWNGGGPYPGFLVDEADTVTVKSDGGDQFPQGSGARLVRIYGLDENYVEQQEDIEMNGPFAATSTNTFIRVSKVLVHTSGSEKTNVGRITCSKTGDATIVLAILRERQGSSSNCLYTVPAGKTAYFKHIECSANASTPIPKVNVSMQIRKLGESFVADRYWSAPTEYPLSEIIRGALPIPEKSDIVLRQTSTGRVLASLDFLMVDNADA